MPLIDSAWSQQLQSSIPSYDRSSSFFLSFCNAISSGSIISIKAGTFVTVDTGTTPGAGIGTGIGVTGLVASSIESSIISECSSAFSSGTVGSMFRDMIAGAIASVFVGQMALAVLSSSHPLVYVGSAQVSSIVTNAATWGMNIANAAPDLQGVDWPALAQGIATSCSNSLSTCSAT